MKNWLKGLVIGASLATAQGAVAAEQQLLNTSYDIARELFAAEHVTVLPGSFLSREVDGFNPGAGRVRMALVASLEECVEAAERIRRFLAA